MGKANQGEPSYTARGGLVAAGTVSTVKTEDRLWHWAPAGLEEGPVS